MGYFVTGSWTSLVGMKHDVLRWVGHHTFGFADHSDASARTGLRCLEVTSVFETELDSLRVLQAVVVSDDSVVVMLAILDLVPEGDSERVSGLICYRIDVERRLSLAVDD